MAVGREMFVPKPKESVPRFAVPKEVQDLLRAERVREDVCFLEVPFIKSLCGSSGNNIFKWGAAVVGVASGFYEADKGACTWAVKREIAHIKSSDVFMTNVVSLICQLAASIFGCSYLSFLPAVALAWSVGYAASALFSRWREAKADDFAIKHSSVDELMGGKAFLIAQQEINVAYRQTAFLGKLLISPSGEKRLNLHCPSLASRIKKIEQALVDRHESTSQEGERERVDALKGCMEKQIFPVRFA